MLLIFVSFLARLGKLTCSSSFLSSVLLDICIYVGKSKNVSQIWVKFDLEQSLKSDI